MIEVDVSGIVNLLTSSRLFFFNYYYYQSFIYIGKNLIEIKHLISLERHHGSECQVNCELSMVRHMLRFWLTSAFCLYQTCKWKCFTEKVECQNDLICFFSFRAQSLVSGHTETHIKSIYHDIKLRVRRRDYPGHWLRLEESKSQRASSFTKWKSSAQGCVTGHILSYPRSPMDTWLVTWLMWRCYCFS